MRLCKSKLTTKLILLALMIFAITAIISVRPIIAACEQDAAQLSYAIDMLEQENEDIKEDIRALGSDQAVIDIAHERLNLVFEDEVILVDTN